MPDSCKACGASVCGCSDVLWNGTVIIDDPDHGGSEPGSYARHIRDTACMATDFGRALTGRALVNEAPLGLRPAGFDRSRNRTTNEGN